MSASSATGSCLDRLFAREFVLSDWKGYFEPTKQVLGNSGAICSLPDHAKLLDFPRFVHSIFLVKHPQRGLVAFQIQSFDADNRTFMAHALESAEIEAAVEMCFSCDIIWQIPFVARSHLLDLVKKVSAEFHLILDMAYGLSCTNSQDGGMDFVLGSPSEVHYQFHVTSVSLSSSATHATLAETVRHGPADPTKTAPIHEIPPAVCEVLFAGRKVRPDLFSSNRAFTHFYCAISANLWLLPGEEGSRVRDSRLHVAVPKAAAIMFLNACWISLGHFQTEDNEQRVADAFSMPPPQLIDLRIVNATDALEAWENCRDVLDRLFLLTSEFKIAWARISTDMSEVIRCSHQFADIRCNGAVYDILDHLGLRLFQHLSNPSITVEQVRLALSDFRVVAEERWFMALYDSAQRRFAAGPPVLLSMTGFKRVADETEVDEDSPGQPPRRPCFNYFSTQGCSATACRFSHGSLTVKHKALVLSALASKGLLPDADKV
jgi:hypothetical protein